MEVAAAAPLVTDLLTPCELAAYEFVLFTDDWSLEALSDALSLPAAEAADLIERLVDRRLLRPSQVRPDRLVAVPPRVGLSKLTSEAEDKAVELATYAHRLRTVTSMLAARHDDLRHGDVARFVEVIEGHDRIVGRITELVRDAKRCVDTAVLSELTPKALEQALTGDLNLLDRGVRVRGLYLESHRLRSAALREYLTVIGARGAEIRVAASLPTRFMVFDEEAIAVAVHAAQPSVGAIVLHVSGLVPAFARLFDLLWLAAKPMADSSAAQARAKPLLSEVELSILQLLAKGNKDDAISRRTGMSVRSVRRVIADLNERLGANSRFMLGLRCHELGLI